MFLVVQVQETSKRTMIVGEVITIIYDIEDERVVSRRENAVEPFAEPQLFQY